MSKRSVIIQTGIALFFSWSALQAQSRLIDTTFDNLRIELHSSPPEPFFTKDHVSEGNVKQGMLIMGGERPFGLDASTRPNLHLALHVFDVKTALAIKDARVKMSFQALDSKGNVFGDLVDVPIVVMRTVGKDTSSGAGKGEQTVHYGNNVSLPDGPYVISLSINDKKLRFTVTHLFAQRASMEGSQY
jgi:hypothetical protein